MYINFSSIDEYPFRGTFYKEGVDENKSPLEQVDEKTVVLETKCDIQEASHTDGELLTADYTVYFPLGDGLDGIKNGILFEGDMYGAKVNGKVVGVFPSQLGGVKVYVQDLDV
jgi:hypothetical protein